MSAPAARIVSLRAGRARTHARPDWDHARERTWTSAYVKDEVAGPVRATRFGLEGDQQFDRAIHGGPEMALLAYAASHYDRWREEPGLAGMGPGAFGENLAVEGLDETSVCVGDVWEVGGARLQVSSPRGPCANISRRWNAEWLRGRVRETRRTGWYLRVLREGHVAAGDAIAVIERPHADWSVDRLLAIRYERPRDEHALRSLADCPALSPEWRARYAKLLARA